MKSGTSYLHALLNSHPSIFMSEPKEPSYFVSEQQLKVLYPQIWRHGYWQSEDRYLELFNPANRVSVIGESSVFYTFLPGATGVAERIKQFNPNAQLIYLMRDPIERTISHYWHNVRHFGEHRPPLEAIERDRQYVCVSDYAMQLKEYFRWFDRDQIMILTFEDLIQRTEQVIGSIFSRLGVDGPSDWRSVEPQNVSPASVKRPIWKWQQMRRRNHLISGAIEHLPEALRQFGVRVFTREVEVAGVDMSRVVEHLRPLQQAQTEDLTRLIGRQFPEWSTLCP